MKRETQTIEFKQSWHDEYLEWICGYANAYGGTLYIGRNDDGTPCGVARAKSLMESIPCKITDTMTPFNPKLAQVFFKSGLIEAWGRGFDKIKAGCEEYGGELPDYEISDSGVMVLCKACPAYSNLLKNAVKTTSGGEVKSKGKSKGKYGGASAGKIIMLLADNPSLRQNEIAGKTGLSLPGVEKIMRRLRNEGKLVREGSSRNGLWKVIRKE